MAAFEPNAACQGLPKKAGEIRVGLASKADPEGRAAQATGRITGAQAQNPGGVAREGSPGRAGTAEVAGAAGIERTGQKAKAERALRAKKRVRGQKEGAAKGVSSENQRGRGQAKRILAQRGPKVCSGPACKEAQGARARESRAQGVGKAY
jgi:hypothetical protein